MAAFSIELFIFNFAYLMSVGLMRLSLDDASCFHCFQRLNQHFIELSIVLILKKCVQMSHLSYTKKNSALLSLSLSRPVWVCVGV